MTEERMYLGDGLYAWCDGWYIWLEAERDGMTHKVALEPDVYASLQAYVERLTETNRRAESTTNNGG